MNRDALGHRTRTPRGVLSRAFFASAAIHAAALGAGIVLGWLSSGGESRREKVFTARFEASETAELPFEEPEGEELELVEPAEAREPELRESEVWSMPDEFAALADEPLPAGRPRFVDWLAAPPLALGELASSAGEAVAGGPALEPGPIEPRAARAPPPPAVVVEPVPREAPPPAYPPLARRIGEEGSVLLRLHLDERGAVVRVEIVESSGSARLDQAAKEALAAWRFEPRREDGRAVAASVLHRITFRLDRGASS